MTTEKLDGDYREISADSREKSFVFGARGFSEGSMSHNDNEVYIVCFLL
jgi:hypothetical protein